MSVDRHWDPEGTYVHLVIHEYEHWVVEVSARQFTLGSFIIFCSRKGVTRFTDLNQDEMISLKQVMRDMEAALAKLELGFVQYMTQGDESKSLRFYGSPRYDGERTFSGRLWKDKSSWKRYPEWPLREQETEELSSLHLAIQSALLAPSA